MRIIMLCILTGVDQYGNQTGTFALRKNTLNRQSQQFPKTIHHEAIGLLYLYDLKVNVDPETKG